MSNAKIALIGIACAVIGFVLGSMMTESQQTTAPRVAESGSPLFNGSDEEAFRRSVRAVTESLSPDDRATFESKYADMRRHVEMEQAAPGEERLAVGERMRARLDGLSYKNFLRAAELLRVEVQLREFQYQKESMLLHDDTALEEFALGTTISVYNPKTEKTEELSGDEARAYLAQKRANSAEALQFIEDHIAEYEELRKQLLAKQ